MHWVDAGLDTGEVISQEKVEILEGDTEESLHERIKIVERGLIVATIHRLLPMLES
jgi:phosphoribosylglycinamide formyltransferase-1